MRAGVIIASILLYAASVGLCLALGGDTIVSDRRPSPLLAAIF